MVGFEIYFESRVADEVQADGLKVGAQYTTNKR